MVCSRCGTESAGANRFCPQCGSSFSEGSPGPAANAASLQPNVAAALCYALGPVTGLAFTILEKESKLVRFHAMQSMVVFGAATVALVVFCVLPVVGSLLGLTFGMLWLTLAIVLMVKAYSRESFKLPFAGDFAEKNS